MSELPDEWRAYARLQETLSRTFTENNRSRAMEAALSGALVAMLAGASTTVDDLQRAQRSAERRERNRAALRVIWVNSGASAADPEPALASLFALRRIKTSVSGGDWDLLYKVAFGHAYDELTVKRRASQAQLRGRVLRLRRLLQAAA